MTYYYKYTIIDNDNPHRVTISTAGGANWKNQVLDQAARVLKTTNIRIIAERELTPFEVWADLKKGMLIDKDADGQYKSLETRAAFETWQAAQAEPLYIIGALLKAHKSDRRINRKLKFDIRKDFDVCNAEAGANKILRDNGATPVL